MQQSREDGASQSAAPHVASLGAIRRDSLPLVGGKAAQLGELMLAGFPVPEGFCVTTRAFREVAALAGLGPILDALAATGPEDASRLAEYAAKARDALLSAPIPSDIAAEITAAYEALGTARIPVAVRSSATAEDLPTASFAGQQETLLNVRGAESVVAAVRQSFASLFTDRAVAYRAAQGIAPDSVEIAVVVQRMVDPRVSGVLFTANPVTGRRRQAVIDASPGLGEAIVSGAVTPDHFVVDTARGQILERGIGEKKLAVEALDEGGTRHVEREASAEPCLRDGEIRALAELGARVEAHYRAPQDIEWAIDGEGRTWILQARPITTLFPLPAQAPTSDEELRVYFSTTLDEGVSRPLTPMGIHGIRRAAAACAHTFWGNPLDDLGCAGTLVEAAQRLYWDFTPLLRNKDGRRLVERMFQQMEAEAHSSVQSILDDPRLSVRNGSPWTVARAVFAPIWRTSVLSRALLALRRPDEARAEGQRLCAEALAFGDVPERASPVERLEAVERLLSHGGALLPAATCIEFSVGHASFALARRLLEGIATEDESNAVLRGLPHNPTTEMNLSLWALAVEIRKDAESARSICERDPAELAAEYRKNRLPAPLQDKIAGFLRAYGHRGVAEIDLGLPRWSDDPSHVFGVLANYLRLEDPAAAPDVVFRRSIREGEEACAELGRRAAERGRIRGALVRLFLSRARELSALRELPKFQIVKTFSRAHDLLLEVGDALVGAERLAAADDIFFVTMEEARRGLSGEDLRGLVRDHRAQYEREMRRKHIPSILLSDGREPATELAVNDDHGSDVLVGLAASAGVVTGRARVVLEPTGVRLEPGDILVVPSTDPAWTPLFLTAAGLVMDRGGPMSHGSVIAREYGIPAVVGAAGATRRIHTGQTITVDGLKGVVHLAPG